jgi:peptidoglycan/LPS O-acetylase OafA/YrhL
MYAKRLEPIQVLRGAAAVSVVVMHAIDRAARIFPEGASYSFLVNFHNLQRLGAAGVDIFFVISGFIMMYTQYDRFGEPKAPLTFIKRRVVRIAPLYWALTALAVALLAVAPSLLFYHRRIDTGWVIGSFLFILIAPKSGIVQPVIGQGWTLNFEMFFYGIFTGALLMPRRLAIPAMFLIFGLLITCGFMFPNLPAWLRVWTNTLLLEFLSGVLIAIAYRHRLPIFSHAIGRAAIALGLMMFAVTIWSSPAVGWQRPLFWGVPASLVVLGALSLKPSNSSWTSLWILLGDSSYSIYLFHVFALPGLSLVLKHVLAGYSISVDLAAGILAVAAVGMSVGCWYAVERPLTRLFDGLLRKV